MPAELLAEVNVDVAWPAVIVPADGAIAPLVALKDTGISGTGPPAGVAAAELCVISAVTVESPPGVVGFGEALVPSTIHGSASTAAVPLRPIPFGADEQPAPPVPGP